jgi:hypothetical protein
MMAEEKAHQWREGSSEFVDAYIDWVRGAAKRLLDKAEASSVPVLVSLPGTTEGDFLHALRKLLPQTPDKRQIDPFFGVCPGLKSTQFTLMLPRNALELLRGAPSVTRLIHRITIAHNLPPHATRKSGDEVEPLLRDKEYVVGKPETGTVVMGIIDEGIAFVNQRFRSGPCSSRVKYAWIQDGRAEGKVPYGLELTKTEIDEALRKCTSAGQVDEDLFYSTTGVVDFGQSAHKAAARRAGHGTHVMDLACGYDEGSSPTSEGKDQRPIVCVKLPTVTVADTSGLGLEYYVLDGVDYILRRAQDIAEERGCGELPVVINFSSGILAGPRDGTQPIELAIDARISRRMATAPTDVVLPSGNSRLSRLHAKISLPANSKNRDERTLQFRVLPDDRTCSYLEIWLPTRDETWPDDDWMKLTLKPPGGQKSTYLMADAGKRAIEWAPDGNVLCKVYYEFIGPPTNRGRYMIALLPTALPDSEQQLAPFGTWTIGFKNPMDKEIDVEASIQWDDRPLGYPQNGRQSHFIDDCYQRFDEISGREVEADNESMIKRDGSINAIATGSRTIVAAGYVRKENRVVEYSSGGPISPAAAKAVNRQGPDAVARSDESYVHQGILAAGTRSGSVVAMNGTSVAAPRIARQIAKEREEGETRCGREIVRELGKLLDYDSVQEQGEVSVQLTSPERGPGRVVSPEIDREIERLDRLDGLDERIIGSD